MSEVFHDLQFFTLLLVNTDLFVCPSLSGYPNMFMHASREKVTKNLEALYSFYREDLLRTSITQLAASPEAFLMLRSEFAKSLAAINVCSYLLGIGDRHLENFLVDKSTGCMIPIDFGHAFGSATEVLPVPELVPFRLTRQLSSFLNPLGPKGLLEHPMVCIMKALQGKKDIILNTMDVFVKEPLLDWRKFALNQAKQQSTFCSCSFLSPSLSLQDVEVLTYLFFFSK